MPFLPPESLPATPFTVAQNLTAQRLRNQALQQMMQQRQMEAQQRQEAFPLDAALKRAQTLNYLRQAQQPVSPYQSNFGKAYGDYQALVQQYGENSSPAKLAKQNLERLSRGSGGLSLGFGENGELTSLMFGGSQVVPGTAGRGPGAILKNPETGEVTILPTRPVQNRQERSLGASAIMDKFGPNLVKLLPYVGPLGKARLLADRTAAQTGLASAEQQERLRNYGVGMDIAHELAAEKAVLYGLQPTERNLNDMLETILPRLYETQQTYLHRVQQSLLRSSQLKDRDLSVLSGSTYKSGEKPASILSAMSDAQLRALRQQASKKR